MIRRQTILLIALLIVVDLTVNSYGCVFAQNLPLQSEIEKMTSAEKILLYQNMQQDPVENMVRSYLLPTHGHYRVNNWERGAKIYFGGILISVGLGISLETVLQKNENEGYMYAMIGGVITHIWQIVDAGKQTKIYNNNLHKKLFGKEPPSMSFKLKPTYQGANLTMSYAFD